MAEKFDNPNYNPEAGMKFLTTHFEMFNPDVAKAMIADAKRKGVKIPPVVEEKARKAGIMNAVRNARDGFGAEIKVGDIAKFITGTWRGLEGTVVKIEGDKATVRTKKHGNVVEDLKLVRVYNSVRNAKFKVGDKVKFKNLFKPERGEETGVVTGYDTDGSVLIRDDDGIKVKASEKLVRLANSVRNAKFKVGDTVEAIRDRVHKLGVKGTVLKVDADAMVVKWADDGFTARYGIEGNFKNLTKEPKATPEDKMKTELSRSGAGSNPRTAHTWLTRHRRGLVSKYGREVYEKVMREATRGLLNAQIRSTNAIVAKAMKMDGNSVCNARLKVGDRVKVTWNPDDQRRGIVGKTGELLRLSSEGTALVDIDGHEYFTFRPYLELANSVGNAKFKVGDEVVFKANGHRGEVKKIDGGKIGVRWALSSSVEWHNEDELQKSANSVRCVNTKWVIYYWDGGKEKIEAPTPDAARREADKRASKSGRKYKKIAFDDGVDDGINSVRNAKYVKGAKVVSPKGTVRGEIVGVRSIYQHGFKDEVFDVLLESGPRKGEVMRSQTEGEWDVVNSVRSTNAVVAKALAMNGAAEKWGDPNAKMLKEKNGWQLWEGTHGYGMYRSNGHGGVWWGKVRRAAAIKHFDKFVADPIRTSLTINAVRNAWADAPDAATAKRDIEQTVRKAADIAKRRSGAKATYKMTPNDSYWCGFIELTFNTEEEAKKYNPYYLFNELEDNKSILPKWSWAISSFNYQKNGKVVKIFVGRFAT